MKPPAVATIVACVIAAVVIRVALPESVGFVLAVLAFGYAVTLAYTGLIAWNANQPNHVLRLWGLTWTRDEACCHFFITGATGTGKTARAVIPIVHGLRKTEPQTGILAIDSKGAL